MSATVISVKTLIMDSDSWNGKQYEGTAELSIHKDSRGTIHVKMTKGGSTGFEGFSVFASHKLEISDWYACLGKRDEYNKVTVPKEEMERAYREAGIVP